MEEEAIITAVQPGAKATINGSLDLEFLNVRFRVLGVPTIPPMQNRRYTAIRPPRRIERSQLLSL
jgi:hypothetical protein